MDNVKKMALMAKHGGKQWKDASLYNMASQWPNMIERRSWVIVQEDLELFIQLTEAEDCVAVLLTAYRRPSPWAIKECINSEFNVLPMKLPVLSLIKNVGARMLREATVQ